jgi:hypothetical protein
MFELLRPREVFCEKRSFRHREDGGLLIGEVELEFALLVGGVQWAAIALLDVVVRKVTTNSKGFGKAIAIVSCG